MASLSSKELEKCIQYSLENAGRYLNDALLLYNEKKYESSILLSHLSYEESGKALLAMDYRNKQKEDSYEESMEKKIL